MPIVFQDYSLFFGATWARGFYWYDDAEILCWVGGAVRVDATDQDLDRVRLECHAKMQD